MPSITVKDISDDLYERFQEVAQAEGRSIEAEVIVAMEQLVQWEGSREERLAALERINARRRQRPPCTLDSVEMLREDREC